MAWKKSDSLRLWRKEKRTKKKKGAKATTTPAGTQRNAESNMNFTEIAEVLGFGSIHHFSKFFKAKTGLTPSAYARSIDKR